MARAQPKARAARPAPVSVERAASDPDQGLQQAMALNAQWARDALAASLLHTQGLFNLLQTLQQAQARALHDASADIERAIEALRAAEDAPALAEVPGRFISSQWQHSLENVGSTAGRLMEIETAWLQQAQAQASRQLAAVAAAGNGQATMAAAPVMQGNGADEAALAWAQWVEQWQRGVNDMSRAWSEAVRAAQPRA
jgi:hypothetical protein